MTDDRDHFKHINSAVRAAPDWLDVPDEPLTLTFTRREWNGLAVLAEDAALDMYRGARAERAIGHHDFAADMLAYRRDLRRISRIILGTLQGTDR